MSAAERPTSYTELAQVLDALPLLLREARRARRLSVRAAAKEMHLSFSTISRMENGREYHIQAALSVLRWLDHPRDGETP